MEKRILVSTSLYKKNKSIVCIKTVLFATILFFSGCAVQLAPRFDQNIVDNLSATSTQTFQLLASVSSGVKNTDYDKREERYNDVIGLIEAAELQINARPMPKNKTLSKLIDKANEKLKEKGINKLISANDVAPSASALAQVEKNIVKMKEVDKAQGLTATEVQAFQGDIVLYLDQAITYESFLNQ